MAKINISIEDDTLSRADVFAKNNGISRSALISIALNDYIYAKEKEPAVKEVLEDFEKRLKELLPQN